MAPEQFVFTENFSANLGDVENFLGEEGAGRFSRFFDRFVDEILPNLRQFPRSGRSFFNRSILSTQAVVLNEKMRPLLEAEDDVRELIVDEYIVLYLLRGEQIVFLAIKHRRQLSFDFASFWRD